MRDALLVVGNGIAMDLRSHVAPALAEWNTSSPLQWNLLHPLYGRPLWDLLPLAAAALDAATTESDFERMQAVLRMMPDDEFPYAEVELRHYLAMAFSMYQLEVDRLEVGAWSWARFIKKVAPRLRGVLSLNYDTTTEDLVRAAGQRTYFPGLRLTPWEEQIERLRSRPSVALVKPHGSIDFRAGDGTIAIEVEYPLRNWLSDNDLWLNRCYRTNWLQPRIAADVVIPTEISRFRDFQWTRPGAQWLRANAPRVRECYIVGFSYAECDRADVGAALDHLSPGTRVVVADPSPAESLLAYLDDSGHRVELWTSGPRLEGI